MAEPRDWSWFESPKQAKRRRERMKWEQQQERDKRGGPPDRRGSGEFRGPLGPFPPHGNPLGPMNPDMHVRSPPLPRHSAGRLTVLINLPLVCYSHLFGKGLL